MSRPRSVVRPVPCTLALAVLLATILTTGPARASQASGADDAELHRALDAVLACERPDGGWSYGCTPGPDGAVTKIVVRAQQVAELLGLPLWDLLVVRSPGTPAGGLVLLAGWRRTGDERWLAGARRAGDVLVATQLASGGWASEMPVHGTRLAPWFRWLNRWTALDDDVTSGGARFLVELWAATGEPAYRAAAERAFDLLLAAQLPDGAWPLTWRVPRWLTRVSPSFEELPSTNDGATAGPIEALLVGAGTLGRADLRAAARRGGDWLVSVQAGHGRDAWAQQYASDGTPAPGRRFEPAGFASWETREMLDALLALAREPGPRENLCPSIAAGAAWLARVPIAPGCWARLYGPDDERPLYVARDGTVVATADEAKRPYKWTGEFGIPALLATVARTSRATPGGDGTAFPPRRILGDAGSCPGGPPAMAEDVPNPRARIARAAVLLAAAEPPPPDPCARP
jgi:hypothetical protein